MEWVNFLMEALRQSQHSPALTSTPTSLPNLKKKQEKENFRDLERRVFQLANDDEGLPHA